MFIISFCFGENSYKIKARSSFASDLKSSSRDLGPYSFAIQDSLRLSQDMRIEALVRVSMKLVPATHIEFSRVYLLAKPDALNLVLATALLISSTTSIMIPKFGGRIIDIVSRDISTPEKKNEALNAVKSTILEIIFIVVIGELLSRLSEDTQIIKNAVTTNLSETLRSLSTIIIGLGFMFTTSWKLTLLSLTIVPAVSIAVRKFGCYLRELSHKAHADATVAASIAEESFGAISTVRSFAQEDYEISRYSEKVDETLKLELKQDKVVDLFSRGLNAASTLSVIVVVIYGANLTITGLMTTGALTSFILYSLIVGSSVSALSGLYSSTM
ncbi:hypothetical protein GIB67_028039 [Kingdonia uniflora]|uniref:ABC transmembrane type-1 domain-containing protein n=1 Tax=Kingdonia uniflora TaxID=39325 RepID=A0A7J7NEQ7_9MAGN|nr:hypothetical protein GIB67_028039 [Kingdonia uniflora]